MNKPAGSLYAISLLVYKKELQNSFKEVKFTEMEGLRKTISHSLFLTFSSSSLHSSLIPIAAAENPSCFNCSS